MERDTFYADINKEAKTRRLKWGHISNYPAVLIEQLLQDKTITIEERNELIQWQISSDPDPSTWMPVLLADLRSENEQLRAIVQEVAEMPQDGYYYNDSTDRMECPFCADSWGWDSHSKHTKDHTPECIVTLARALMQKREAK